MMQNLSLFYRLSGVSLCFLVLGAASLRAQTTEPATPAAGASPVTTAPATATQASAAPAPDAGGEAKAAPAKKQLPADERAWRTARAAMDPQKRLEAMRAFVRDYPKSKSRAERAQDQILTTLVNHFPERTAEIDAQAKLIVKTAGKGLDGASKKTYVAFLLAEAGTAGVDLPYAEKIAKDAANQMKEGPYDENMTKTYAKFKEPAPKPEEMHKRFANERAEALAVLADVYLREGKPEKASPLVGEAYGLDPLVDDVNSQRGRLALMRHDEAQALESFERAQLLGAVSEGDRKTMMELYRKAHGGSDADFTAELDGRYAKLYPEAFQPAAAAPVTTGRTVLLELFTGSACGPCVGGDLAVEGLLHAYPRSELVALAFDQHIPEPDPLTNPDSLARAEVYDVGSTPNYVIDGTKQQAIYGSDRDGSKKLYEKLVKVVDGEASLASGVEVKLSATEAAGGMVHAEASVTLPEETAIEKAIAAKPKVEDEAKSGETAAKATPAKKEKKAKAASEPAAKPAPEKPAEAAVPTEPAKPHLAVNFALVEDEVRYSGENGVRFHRMVVRALAKHADAGFEVHADGAATFEASFDPAAISRSLTSYLDGFEAQNDRFGKITFLTKDMTMQAAHLGVAVWVQDTVSHKVLQAAFVPLEKTAVEEAGKGTE